MKELGSTLVIRPGALGDAVLTLPALLALKLAGAGPINVLGNPSSWAFLRADIEGLRVHDFSSSQWLGLFADGATMSEPVKKLLAATDLAVVYLSGDCDAIEKRLRQFGVKRVKLCEPPTAGPQREGNGFSAELKATCKPKYLPPTHASRRLFEALDTFVHPQVHQRDVHDSLKLDASGWLTCSADERTKAIEYLKQVRSETGLQEFVGIHPGSGGMKKRWPLEYFAELATRYYRDLRVLPLVFFGPAEDKMREQFEHAMPHAAEWRILENQPLREVFSILKLCRVFIGNDAGMSHLAARATKTLAIFGPTDFSEWMPVGEKVCVIQAPMCDLTKLSVESVWLAAESI